MHMKGQESLVKQDFYWRLFASPISDPVSTKVGFLRSLARKKYISFARVVPKDSEIYSERCPSVPDLKFIWKDVCWFLIRILCFAKCLLTDGLRRPDRFYAFFAQLDFGIQSLAQSPRAKRPKKAALPLKRNSFSKSAVSIAKDNAKKSLWTKKTGDGGPRWWTLQKFFPFQPYHAEICQGRQRNPSIRPSIFMRISWKVPSVLPAVKSNIETFIIKKQKRWGKKLDMSRAKKIHFFLHLAKLALPFFLGLFMKRAAVILHISFWVISSCSFASIQSWATKMVEQSRPRREWVIPSQKATVV